MTDYAKALTKEDLINRYGITNVSKDGKVYGYAKGMLREFPQPITTTNNGKKHYKIVQVYDRIDHVKVPRTDSRTGKPSYTYKSRTLGVHRVVAAWFYGEVPAGKVVDHINNDPLDNRLENLQIITQGENLAKDRAHNREPMTCDMNKPLSWYEDKLTQYLAKNEEAKEAQDAELAHHYRSLISQYRAKIKYWKLHESEFFEHERRKAATKLAERQVVERAQEVKRLKKLLADARKTYKDNPTQDNKYGYEVAKSVYQNFLVNHPALTIAERTEYNLFYNISAER